MGKDRVAVVTGSTAGIGRAVALALASEGFSIIGNGRRAETETGSLRHDIETASGTGDAWRYVRGDIADETTRKDLLNAVESAGRGLSVLVNNAGMPSLKRKDMLELTEDEMLRILRVNCIAPFLLTSLLAPQLGRGGPDSCVINISSISAYTASTDRADYCISKAGLSMATRLFASRLAGDGVRVYEIRPGIIETDMTAPVLEKYDRLIEQGLLPIARRGEPEDVARAVLGIVKGFVPYSTGQVLDIDGGFHLRRL